MTTAFNIKVAECPGCGAQLQFKVGTSRVIVCEYCHYAVARTNRGLETIGKIADLVPTGARLALGMEGKYQGVSFRLAGRLQYGWAQGAWDEWYASFTDGRWGSIAEAQGRYYVSFRSQPRPVPAFEALKPGERLSLPGAGEFAVSDLKRAFYIGAVGELPERFAPKEEVRTADLSGEGGIFATLDYGASGNEATLFVGWEDTLDALGLGAAPMGEINAGKLKGAKLVCPQCNGPLELKAPDQAMRVTCPSCSALLDTTEGTLRYLDTLKPQKIAIPLGSKGKLFGVEYLVIGWLQRSCRVEGADYFWEEYLLYDERTAGFRFLVCSDQHWSFVVPVPPGEVREAVGTALWRNKTFKLFSAVQAVVTSVLGEFYWAVARGETVAAADFVLPPESLSKESNDQEVTWSHATYLEGTEVFKAFGVRGKPTPPSIVGMMQPNPHERAWRSNKSWLWLSLAAAFALFVVFLIRASTLVLQERVQPNPLASAAANPSAPLDATAPALPPGTAILFSQPFRIEQGGRNLRVRLNTSVSNTWAALSGALINQTTNEFREFAIETSYYSGVEGGESWSEGSHSDDIYLSTLEPGEYVLREELAWEPGKVPPTFDIELTSGVARGLHFLLVMIPLVGFALISWLQKSSFEGRRWAESNVGGSGGDDD